MWRAIRKFYLPVLVALCSSGVVRPGNGETIDLSWLAKTSQGAKILHEKYEALSSRLEEECEYRSDKVPGATSAIPFRAHTRRERVVRLDDNVILEQLRSFDASPSQPQIRLQCDNNDYHFMLTKSREDSPYVLVEYAPGKRKIPLLQQQPGLHNTVFSYLRDILGAINNDGKHSLQILRFDDTKRLLLVQYTITAGDTAAQNQIYLDPSHDWRVAERRVETSNLVATERWNYGVTVGGLEFPAEYKNLTIYKVTKAPPNLEITGRLLSLKITDKTSENFRLSAFDLPEPINIAPLPKPTRWYLWILIAAITSAGLAMLFAWLKRRHTKTDTFSSKGS